MKAKTTKIKVTLFGRNHRAIALVDVPVKKDQQMPKHLLFANRLFMFDDGLEHCGERYNEVDVLEIDMSMVRVLSTKEEQKWQRNAPNAQRQRTSTQSLG